jgi:hypothetical protein
VTKENERGTESERPASQNIKIGGDVGPGSAIGAGASVQADNIAGRDLYVGAQTEQPQDVFVHIYQVIEKTTFADEKTAKTVNDAVEVIQTENEKGDQANETSLKFSLNMLAQMAPDIWDVVVSTLANPVLGISTVVNKIAQKAKQERADS